MLLKELYLKNFRCFETKKVTFESNLVSISGVNGSGKTSLLEAIHYLGYLQSFRTHGPRELVRFDQQDFFVRAVIKSSADSDASSHDIQVGVSGKKRLVKVDQKAIGSYKELMSFYRVITITEDDLELVKGGPEMRRSFIDQTIMLLDPDFANHMRAYKVILHNRNRLLQTGVRDMQLIRPWTQQLWEHTRVFQQRRREMLAILEGMTCQLITAFLDSPMTLAIPYLPKVSDESETFEAFMDAHTQLFADEQRMGRSLFGAHLDDFAIEFRQKQSRLFASRGQQKCIIVLLKVAQLQHLARERGTAILLLDDFMTDFDQKHIDTLLTLLLSLEAQLIFTVPTGFSYLLQALSSKKAQHIDISI